MKANRTFSTAAELLDFFNPSKQPWSNYGYLFRAQYEYDDQGYELIPSIFRKPVKDSYLDKKLREVETFISTYSKAGMGVYGSIRSKPELLESIKLAAAEKKILRDFVMHANKLGMQVPEADKILNYEYTDFTITQDQEVRGAFKYNPKITSLNIDEIFNLYKPALFAGLAQHHGCPTRLLDFSYNPYKALFHAINREKVNDDGVLSLYYVPENLFSKYYVQERIGLIPPEKKSSVYQLIRMPSSHNHYLFQQEGLFAFPITPFHHYFYKGEYPSINSFVEMMQGNNPESNQLKKISIPSSEHSNLKKLLKTFNISLSSMMPNLDNIVKEMKEDI